ncbi:MAG: hypothetical protein KAU31_14575, partial [Spirochaetaceae bacterium]|nr:hypothetical protein [Spirochaetaceae bacterium]
SMRLRSAVSTRAVSFRIRFMSIIGRDYTRWAVIVHTDKRAVPQPSLHACLVTTGLSGSKHRLRR